MQHSFVSTPVSLDLDNDGAIDTIFANDISGQVWRIDLRAADPSNRIFERIIDTTTAGVIADLSKTDNEAENRFFYNSLDVSVVSARKIEGANVDAPTRLNLVIGSGNRANPRLDNPTSGDNFYVIFDSNLSIPPSSYSYVTDSSGNSKQITLSNISTYDANSTSTTSTPFASLENGFKIELDDPQYEKVLATTITINGTVVGVSYSPEITSEQCSIGGSQLYTINLYNGAVTTFELKQSGIVAGAVLLNLLDDNQTSDVSDDSIRQNVCIGTECFTLDDLGLEEDAELGKAKKTAWWEIRE
jgi:type IV pilus assembly protein PilY1